MKERKRCGFFVFLNRMTGALVSGSHNKENKSERWCGQDLSSGSPGENWRRASGVVFSGTRCHVIILIAFPAVPGSSARFESVLRIPESEISEPCCSPASRIKQ
jgi:hypothetical protein